MFSIGNSRLASRWLAWIGLAILFVATGVSDAGQEEPPIAGRPSNFSGAIGSFKVTTHAAPTSVLVGDPVLFTLRISGTGNLGQIPPPQLEQSAQWRRDFHIVPAGERSLPREEAQEFDYYLRPLTPEIKQIPPFPFVYYKPGFLPAEKGYLTTYAPAIPLVVKRRPSVLPSQIEGPVKITSPPPSVLAFPALDELLQEQKSSGGVPFWLLTLGLLAPPILIALWQLAVGRPEAGTACSRRRRRSKAAASALKALQSLSELPAAEQPARAEEVIVDFLRSSIADLPKQPTRAEVLEHLQLRGVGPATLEATTAFFDRCTRARFGPPLTPGPSPGTPGEGRVRAEDWTGKAIDIIQNLEAESCFAPV